MHVTQSKLWQVCQWVGRFMRAGFCRRGVENVTYVTAQIIDGRTQSVRPLDQCNLRSWIIGDLLMALVGCALAAMIGTFVGLLCVNPIIELVTALMDRPMVATDVGPILLSVIMLHAVMVTVAYVPHFGWVQRYFRGWARIFVWIGNTVTKLFTFIGGASAKAGQHVSERVSKVDVIRQAAKEIKSSVCVVYEQITPEMKMQRLATRMFEQARDLFNPRGSKHYIILACATSTHEDTVQAFSDARKLGRKKLANSGMPADMQIMWDQCVQILTMDHQLTALIERAVAEQATVIVFTDQPKAIPDAVLACDFLVGIVDYHSWHWIGTLDQGDES